MEIDSPNVLGITTIDGTLTVTGTTSVKALSATTLNLTTIGSGTSVNNLGIDALGNIVSGNTSQNWVLGNSYTSGTTAVNNGIIYQSNGTIPSGTTFSLGTTGATWRQIAADANSNYSSGKFYSSGATASLNGIIYRSNNDIPSGTTFSLGTTGSTWTQAASDANSNWFFNDFYSQGALASVNGVMYRANNDIPSGTTFSLGTTGSTWSQAAADANSTWTPGDFYTQGALVTNNGIIYRANNNIPSGTTFSVGTTGTTWIQSASDANATWSSGKTYSAGSLVVNNRGVLYQANNIIPSGTTFSVGTTGITWNQVSRTGKYAYWSPYVSAQTSTPLNTGAVTYSAPNATNLGEDGILLTNINSDNQNASIVWNVTNVDFNQDFRMSITLNIGQYISANQTGDGFSLYAGGSGPTTGVYGGGPGSINFNLITFPLNPDQVLFPAGASIWANGVKIQQGKTGQAAFVGQWITYVVEVSRDSVTNRRFAQVYMTRQDNVYSGRWPIAGGDVTNWVAGGGFCGFVTATGGAREDVKLSQITFESM